MRRVLLPLLVGTLFTSACRDCEGLGNVAAQGAIDPPIYDFGPVTLGAECLGVLGVVNSGNSDLKVEGSALSDSNGDFVILATPQLVGLGASGELQIQFTSAGEVGERQQATVTLQSNDPDGALTGTVTALVAGEPAAVAKTRCGEAGDEASPCVEIPFGAAPVDNPAIPIENRQGVTKSLIVVNDGNAPMRVTFAAIDGGNPDFKVVGARRGNVVVDLLAAGGVEVPPARSGDCGLPDASIDNALSIDVKYSPTALGADADVLVVTTDALEGGEIRVPISGVGSDTGLVLAPETLRFDVAEGDTGTDTLRVSNVGSAEARVDESCVDLGGDGTCDALCTGASDEVAQGLSCKVTKVGGGAEGKGFVLAATDAVEGGDDEREVTVTFAPTAGAADIPAGTTLRLATNILGDKVYEVPIAGGAAGLLTPSSADACGQSICLQAESGTPPDTTTWTGSTTVTLTNDGDASLDVTGITWDGAATIIDDFTLVDDGGADVNLASPGITLAPGDDVVLTVEYANNDNSQQDPVNLVVDHTGLGAQITIEIVVVPPA